MKTAYSFTEAKKQELATAITIEDVLTITQSMGSITGHFWAGDYDEFAEALYCAGWDITYREPFWFVATPPFEDEAIEYIEGDVYRLVSKYDAQLFTHKA